MIIVFSTVDTAEQGVCLAECIEASADDYANGAEVMRFKWTVEDAGPYKFYFILENIAVLWYSIIRYVLN